MAGERYLVDKSALARWGKPAVTPILDDLSSRGTLAICGAVEYEVLYSVRKSTELESVRDMLRGFDWLTTPDEVWDRVDDIQLDLIRAGTHRAISLPDLVIAATAERHGYTVLHYDGDYDLIAAITGHSSSWVVPAGHAD
ncbi:PIN domain-containing protein [Nocardia brasiliensis]